jgi:hypothetical protein
MSRPPAGPSDREDTTMSNNSTRPTHRRRRAWPPAARTAAAIIATATLALPVAAFAASQSTNTQKALAYSRCMRSHGVPRFPDPSSSGAFPKVSAQQVGVSSSQFQAAQSHCRYLLPNGGAGASQTQVGQWMSGMLKFAQCMRTHGVSNWPDPVIDAGGNPEFYLDGKIDQDSPQVKSKIRGCLHWLPSFAISPGSPVACPGADPGPNAGSGCGGCGCRRAPGR